MIDVCWEQLMNNHAGHAEISSWFPHDEQRFMMVNSGYIVMVTVIMVNSG